MRAILVLSSVLLLAACQTLPVPDPNDGGKRWRNDLSVFEPGLKAVESIANWKYSAKVGVKTPSEREQANIVWQFSDQANNVRLFGPLGVGAVRLEFDRYGVVLSDNKGILHRGSSAEDLLTQIIGWPIPLDALSYWLFALPNPDTPFRYQANESGELQVLEQHGWSIRYSRFKQYQSTEPLAGTALPGKLVATKQVAPNQHIEVKLITKSWVW